MMENNIQLLEKIGRFEETLSDIEIKPGAVFELDTYSIKIIQDGHIYYSQNLRAIKYQLGVRIFNATEKKQVLQSWNHAQTYRKEELHEKLKQCIQNQSLIMRCFEQKGEKIIYGIVSPGFCKINPMEFRSRLSKGLEKYGNLIDAGTIIKHKDGRIVEAFQMNPKKYQTRFSLFVTYGINNGFSSYNMNFGRLISICNNGLLKFEAGLNHQLTHYKVSKEKMDAFIYSSLEAGMSNQLQLEEKIETAKSTRLLPHLFQEFNERVHVANAVKRRINEQYQQEVMTCGESDWALSQSLTYLGTHGAYLSPHTKSILTEAGTLVLENTLSEYLGNKNHVLTDNQGFYKSLLPMNMN